MFCQAERYAGLLDAAEADQFGAHLGAEPVGLLVAVDDEQRVPPGEGVGQPRLRGQAGGAFDRPAVDDAAVLAVGPQRRLVTLAQPQRRVAFPRVGEPAGLGQLVGGADPGDEVHPAGRADRGQLAMVPGEQQFRARSWTMSCTAAKSGVSVIADSSTTTRSPGSRRQSSSSPNPGPRRTVAGRRATGRCCAQSRLRR